MKCLYQARTMNGQVCVRGINFASYYYFSVVFVNCVDSVVFFCCICELFWQCGIFLLYLWTVLTVWYFSVVFVNCFDSVVFFCCIYELFWQWYFSVVFMNCFDSVVFFCCICELFWQCGIFLCFSLYIIRTINWYLSVLFFSTLKRNYSTWRLEYLLMPSFKVL